jgi:hypothetical protein
MAFEARGIGPFTGSFGLDIADRLLCIMSREIGFADAVLEPMFSRQQDVPADDPAIGLKKRFKRAPKLVLGLSGSGDIEPCFDGVREIG